MEAIFIPGFFFGFVGFVVWVAISHRTRRATLRADTQKQLLEKFESGPELAAFLETQAGKEFLENNSEDKPSGHRWVGMAQGAIVVIFLSLGFMAASTGDSDILMPGVILLALGLGLLAAALLAKYALREKNDGDRLDSQVASGPIE